MTTTTAGAFQVHYSAPLTSAGRGYWFVYDAGTHRSCSGWMGTSGRYTTREDAEARARQLASLYPNNR